MFSFPFTKKRARTAVVVNVGGASVGVALGTLEAGRFAIAASATVEATLADRTPEHTIVAVKQALREAAEKARVAYTATPTFGAHGFPKIGYAIIESPWSNTCATHAERTLEAETPITKELVGEVARKALEGVCEDSTSPVVRDNIFEATTVRVLLNGYPTNEPAGKQAAHISVYAVISSAEAEILRDTKEVLASLGIEKPTLRSGARALYSVARRVEDTGDEYMIAHLTDGALYFLVIRSGVPSISTVIPLGLNEIVKRVVVEGLPEEALSMFSLIGREACDETACAAFFESLKKFEPELVRIIGEAMVGIAGGRKLSQHLVLYADARVAPWLANVFSRIDFEQFTVTAQPFAVRHLPLPDGLVSEGEGVRVPQSLSIAAALIPIEIG